MQQAQNPYSHVLLITGSRTWSHPALMQDAFNQAWLSWGPQNVTKPLLISGHCPKGADAMAEQLWSGAGFDYLPMPADWDTHGNAAGFTRNLAMVEQAKFYRQLGSQVLATAFIDLCTKYGCPQMEQQQLMPKHMGHWSHGTIHCRNAALAAGIPTLDVLTPPPF